MNIQFGFSLMEQKLLKSRLVEKLDNKQGARLLERLYHQDKPP